jgi:hypothetical protein
MGDELGFDLSADRGPQCQDVGAACVLSGIAQVHTRGHKSYSTGYAV